MKSLVVLFTLIFIASYSFSQDVIIKKNGDKIEAKVVEITTTTIKYKNFEQPEGPIRNIEISAVNEIIYEDGQWDKFDQPTTTTPTTTTPTPHISEPKEVKDPIFGNGFFMDLLLGVGQISRIQYYSYYDPNTFEYVETTQKTSYSNLAISLRFGSKFYFGNGEKWRPGLQVNYLRLGIYMDPSDPATLIIGPKTFSIGNVGMTNAFKFSDKIGMEANITTGLNTEIDLDYGRFFYGLAITPEVKFRLNNLAVGLDYSKMIGLGGDINPDGLDVFSISIGAKF